MIGLEAERDERRAALRAVLRADGLGAAVGLIDPPAPRELEIGVRVGGGEFEMADAVGRCEEPGTGRTEPIGGRAEAAAFCMLLSCCACSSPSSRGVTISSCWTCLVATGGWRGSVFVTGLGGNASLSAAEKSAKKDGTTLSKIEGFRADEERLAFFLWATRAGASPSKSCSAAARLGMM